MRTTIDEVLIDLDRVIDRAITERDRIGYFAAMYRSVTLAVRDGIEAGRFDDGQRMAKLDVVFASRYLDALEGRGGGCTQAWQTSFDVATRWRPLILQHLLAGMNAHINLDLGIAAATVAPGSELHLLHDDFLRINDVLASLVQQLQDDVTGMSPWLGWLERRGGGRADDVIVNFSIDIARDESWRFAQQLATSAPEGWGPLIDARDQIATRIGRGVLAPGPWLAAVALAIRLRESSDVAQAIELLRD